jgi:uncharacterized protein
MTATAILRHLFQKIFLAGFLLTYGQSRAADVADYDSSPQTAREIESSNWLAAVRAALPPGSLKPGPFDFKTTTNLLFEESEHGNNKAQDLWGLTLLVQSRSPEQAEAGIRLIRNSAENGSVQAMLNLGSLYERGKYVRKNYNKAFHWFQMAADMGNAVGQLQLGACYHYGLGTTPDLRKAAMNYRLSAGQTNFVAMKSLGYMLMNGYGVEKDPQEAKYWFTRAANEGNNPRAMYNLGILCSQNLTDTNATVEAFQWYQKSAKLGDDLGCFQLASCYLRGLGVETNVYSYRYWLLKAAFLGDTEAQYFTGQSYRTGDGLPTNMENSLVWYRKAAAKNHPGALYDLALHYLADKTNHVSKVLADASMLKAAQLGHREAQFQCALTFFKDANATGSFETGKTWLNTAGENGWARAEFFLYQLYYNGIAPDTNCPAYPKDRTEAIKWLRRAAEHGHLRAQSILAVKLLQGVEVEQDKPAAEKLLRYSAEHGYASAQNDLGFAILNGDISSNDPVEAAMWCQLAVWRATDPGVLQHAKVNLSDTLSELKEDQQFEAERRAKNFQPLPPAPVDPLITGWRKNPAYQQEDGEFGH